MTDDQLDDAGAELVLREALGARGDARGTDPLVQVLAGIRQTFTEPPADPDRARIAALAATAAAAAAHRRPSASRPRRPRRTVRPAFLAAAVVGCLGVTLGLAAGEHLPAPAQQLVSNVAEVVGVDLPAPDDSPEITVVRREPSPTVATTGRSNGQDRGQPPTTLLPPGDRGADPAVTSGGHGPPLSNPSATAPGSTDSTSPAATAPGSTAPRGRPEDPGARARAGAELGKPEKISG